jgi:hypothetical protein
VNLVRKGGIEIVCDLDPAPHQPEPDAAARLATDRHEPHGGPPRLGDDDPLSLARRIDEPGQMSLGLVDIDLLYCAVAVEFMIRLSQVMDGCNGNGCGP